MKVLHDVPSDLWSAIADQCSYATFFHTYEWARLLQDTHSANCRIAAKAFEFAADEWAVLPLMECESDVMGLVKSYSSNEPGVYGGWISNVELPTEKSDMIWSWLGRLGARKVDVFGNPYGVADAPAGWRRTARFTQVRPLTGIASEEDLLKSYTHGVRYYLRRSAQAGFACRPTTAPADVDAYYGLYAEAVRRWGSSATSFYQSDLFHRIVAAGSPRMELWGAYEGKRLVGGVICFKHRGRWIAWHSAFQPEAFEKGVAKFLHHQIILEAWRQGYELYDFNPSGGHEGTVRFKEGFGTQRLPFTGYLRDDAVIPRMVAGMRAVALRSLW